MCPYYEFECDAGHGRFEEFRSMNEELSLAHCPACGGKARRIYSPSTIRIVSKPRLRLGDGSPGKVITHQETGGLDIYIPSDGAMEQQEVDYIALGAVEKEKDRVKKRKGARSESQARIAAYTDLARKAPRGKRAETIRQAVADTGDRLIRR